MFLLGRFLTGCLRKKSHLLHIKPDLFKAQHVMQHSPAHMLSLPWMIVSCNCSAITFIVLRTTGEGLYRYSYRFLGLLFISRLPASVFDPKSGLSLSPSLSLLPHNPTPASYPTSPDSIGVLGNGPCFATAISAYTLTHTHVPHNNGGSL